MQNFSITDNFNFYELTHTSHRDLLLKNREEGLKHVSILRLICRYLLEPIRENLQTPMIVTSGFRCKELNDKIGGAQTSQHLYGEAVDFKPKDKPIFWSFNEISKMNLIYGQLIYENNNSKEGL